MPSYTKGGVSIRAISLVAVGFGLLIIKQGGTILFRDAATPSAAGNYVPFVLAANTYAARMLIGTSLHTQGSSAIPGLASHRLL